MALAMLALLAVAAVLRAGEDRCVRGCAAGAMECGSASSRFLRAGNRKRQLRLPQSKAGLARVAFGIALARTLLLVLAGAACSETGRVCLTVIDRNPEAVGKSLKNES